MLFSLYLQPFLDHWTFQLLQCAPATYLLVWYSADSPSTDGEFLGIQIPAVWQSIQSQLDSRSVISRHVYSYSGTIYIQRYDIILWLTGCHTTTGASECPGTGVPTAGSVYEWTSMDLLADDSSVDLHSMLLIQQEILRGQYSHAQFIRYTYGFYNSHAVHGYFRMMQLHWQTSLCLISICCWLLSHLCSRQSLMPIPVYGRCIRWVRPSQLVPDSLISVCQIISKYLRPDYSKYSHWDWASLLQYSIAVVWRLEAFTAIGSVNVWIDALILSSAAFLQNN